MARKISFLVLSAAILVIGVTAFGKLGYWERSTRIFSFSSDASGPGRTERGGHGESGEFERPDSHNQPSDNLERKPELRSRNRAETGINNGGIRDGGGHRGGEGGKKINLKNVLWFLAVFASFSIVTRYIDNGISLIRRRKARMEYSA